MRNIVITGASGLVGSSLREWAFPDATGWLVSRSEGLTNKSPSWIWCSRSDVLNHRTDCRATEIVVHLEVKQHVFRTSDRDILEFDQVNVGGTKQWLEGCSRFAVKKFVYFSSIKAVCPESDGPTFETAKPNCDDAYGESKWKAEEYVRNWAKEDPRRSALILRPAVIYGPGSKGNIGAMVYGIMRDRFFLVGAGRNRKSIVSLRNVAAACRHLIDRMTPGVCEAYNIVDRDTTTFRELDALVRRAAGKRGNSPRLPLLAAWSAAKVGDVIGRLSGNAFPINSSRLRALREHSEFSGEKLISTGFQHPQATEEGIDEMIAWFRSRMS